MACNYQGKIVTNGLVLCLDAADKKSYPGTGTVWRDRSGNGNNGTLVNGPTYSNSNGGSLVFDGNLTYGSVSSAQFQSGNNPLTMECWVKWFGNGTNVQNIIFGYGSDIGPNRVPLLFATPNLFGFSFGSGSGDVVSSSILVNTWYHIIATYDLTSCKIYLNGILQNTTSYSSSNVILTGSNGALAGIGSLFSTYGNVASPSRYGTFNGNISKIAYYNRSLSANEIQQNFNATRGRFGI
jgi:hypothetical protein